VPTDDRINDDVKNLQTFIADGQFTL